MDDAQAAHAHTAEGGVRQIDAVLDVAVEQIVIDLVCAHDRAAVLALGRAGAQVRHDDHVLSPDQSLVGKIGDIARDLARLDRGKHVLVAHDLATRLVDDAHAVLHFPQGLGVDHMVGLIGIGDVEADVVAPGKQIVQRFGADDVAREVPGRVHAHERVIAEHGHIQRHREVRHQRARGAETDHAHGLAHQLRSAEGVLALFDERRDLFALPGDGLYPFDAAQHVA